MFHNLLHSASGVNTKQLTLPDTITEWVGKAVCVHPEKGVGVSDRTPVTTYTSFFVDLTLPPSVKRGEVLPVKISVFNYLHEDLPVSCLMFSCWYDELLMKIFTYVVHRIIT